MKVTYTSGNTVFEKECATRKDAIEFVGSLAEVFTGEKCGCCGGKNTAPGFRKHQESKFYEMRCLDCTATLQIVVMENGHMFIGRKDREKQPKPNNGWSVYKAGNQSSGGSSAPAEKHADEQIPF